jgi:hypothetical protein
MHYDEVSPISDSFTTEINTVLSYVIISQRIQKIHVTCTRAADISSAEATTPHSFRNTYIGGVKNTSFPMKYSGAFSIQGAAPITRTFPLKGV